MQGIRAYVMVGAVALGLATVLGPAVRSVSGSDSTPGGNTGLGRGRTAVRSPVGNEAEGRQGGFDALRARYDGVLRQMASGGGSDLETVADIQRAVFAKNSLAGLAKLHRYQLAMTTALGARNPEAFRPIVWLHYKAAGEHRSAADWPLRTPSLMLAADMATSMCRIARSAEDRRFAADVMVCSGYNFLTDGDRLRAVGVFDRVIGFDAGNAPALLGAAAVDERYGRYPEAVERLQKMVEAHPESEEGRLRLAVNLARIQNRDASIDVLEDLVATARTRWVKTVGYQELARRLMIAGRLDQATRVLEQAVIAVPEDHGLKIQLALVLDLGGRPNEAVRVIDSIVPEEADTGDAPRWRYSVWPAFDLEEHEMRLGAQAESAGHALANALDIGGKGLSS